MADGTTGRLAPERGEVVKRRIAHIGQAGGIIHLWLGENTPDTGLCSDRSCRAHFLANLVAEAGLLDVDVVLVNNSTNRALVYRRRYFKVEIGVYGVVWRIAARR